MGRGRSHCRQSSSYGFRAIRGDDPSRSLTPVPSPVSLFGAFCTPFPGEPSVLLRIVAGVVLGAVVFAAASVVSYGLKHPGFLRSGSNQESIIAPGSIAHR